MSRIGTGTPQRTPGNEQLRRQLQHGQVQDRSNGPSGRLNTLACRVHHCTAGLLQDQGPGGDVPGPAEADLVERVGAAGRDAAQVQGAGAYTLREQNKLLGNGYINDGLVSPSCPPAAARSMSSVLSAGEQRCCI